MVDKTRFMLDPFKHFLFFNFWISKRSTKKFKFEIKPGGDSNGS